jgi:PTS system nitrogen regulatory IIA component
MDRDILTIEEVADYLRVSVRTVYDWAQKGEIPCGRLGSSWRFRREAVLAWLEKNIPAFDGEVQAAGIPQLAQVLPMSRCFISSANTKPALLKELSERFGDAPQVVSVQKLHEGIIRREALMSTGLGGGVAIPHVRNSCAIDVAVAFAHVRPPLKDYESIDNTPVEFVAMIAAAPSQHESHVAMLAQIAAKLKIENVREAVRNATTSDQVYAALLL